MSEKLRKSIFTRLLLLILPLVLIADIIILVIEYGLTYRSDLRQSWAQVEAVSREVAEYFETSDPDEPEEVETSAWLFDYVCELADMAYVYCIEQGPEKNSIRYLAIGFGEDAEEEGRKTHYPGVVVYDIDDPKLFELLNGGVGKYFREEHNEYGDMLISYTPVILPAGEDGRGEAESGRYALIGAEMSITEFIREFRKRYFISACYTILTSVLIVLVVIAIVYRKVRVPAREICRRMSEYVAAREKQTHVDKLPVRGSDEFALMAESFNSMSEDIDRYIDHIESMIREKHIADTEMNIARGIQMGLLQPDRMDSGRLSVRAYIQPARDVGGDLYDYCLLDGGRIFTAIADVSGKGISASLFMCRAITLLHQYAAAGYSPAKMLKEYNNVLAEKNPGGLFITTFAAIYDPSEGVLTYSNAGHNIPYILSDRLIPLRDAHGMAAGLFPDEEYEDAQIAVSEGTLFLYTDGVNEAQNEENAFYTTKRLEQKLAACAADGDVDPLQAILDDLNEFVQGAAQSDDITMLSLRIGRQQEKAAPDRTSGQLEETVPDRTSGQLKKTVLHLTSEQQELTRIKQAILIWISVKRGSGRCI